MNLKNLPLDAVAYICAVNFQYEYKLGNRLRALGFVEGNEIRKVFTAPCGDPIAFQVLGTIIAIRKKDAEKITVKFKR